MSTEDIYKAILVPSAFDRHLLWAARVAILGFSGLGLAFVSSNLNALILEWSFLSMGLRGATICLPLVGASFWRGYVKPLAGVVAIGLASLSAILWAIFGLEIVDPLYIGLSVSAGALLLVSLAPIAPSNRLPGKNMLE